MKQLLVPLFLNPLFIFAQPRTIVLQIDSLVLGNYDRFEVTTNDIRSLPEEQFLDWIEDWESAMKTSEPGKISYSRAIVLLNDTSTILLTQDNEGGQLEIRNAYQSKLDTLHIPVYHVYCNPFPDTTFIAKGNFFYAESIFDKSGNMRVRTKERSSENSKTISEPNCDHLPTKLADSALDRYSVTIQVNQKIYSYELIKSTLPSLQISNSDGRKKAPLLRRLFTPYKNIHFGQAECTNSYPLGATLTLEK